MSTTTTLSERAAAQVVEARARAAVVRAALSPAQLAAAEALESSVPARLAVWVMGPDNGKGRQKFFTPGFERLVPVRS